MKKIQSVIVIAVIVVSLGAVFVPKAKGSGSSWVTEAPMFTARAAISSAAIGSKIYVLGGDLFGPYFLSTNEAYDTINNVWTSAQSMSQARSLLVAEAVNGKIYAIGGLPDPGGWCSSDLNEMYDPSTNSWITKAPLPQFGIHAMAGAVVGNKIYILGGYSPPSQYGGANMLDTNFIYDTLTDTWTTGALMPTPRRCEVAAAVGGKIYVIGGLIHTDCGYYTETGANEVYDPQTNSWTPLKSMPIPVERASSAIINDKILVIGGTTTVNSADSYLNIVQVYDTASDSWSTLEGMPTARAYLTSIAVSGTIYVIGGFDGNKVLSINEALTMDTTPPTITISQPNDLSVYGSGSGVVYDFRAVDDYDPNPIVTASLTLFNNQAVPVTSGNNLPTQSGVYTLTITATDASGNTATKSVTFVIYDPTAGFVTGGGWINSPAGAYQPDPTLIGKATFAFVSKYKKGATVPDGNTEFKFQTGNLNFKSTSYEWMVIANAKAQYKGEGTINGTGSYRFILTVIDGDLKGNGSPDNFRIKIWDRASSDMVYDNNYGVLDTSDPTTAIAGGSIVIHK